MEWQMDLMTSIHRLMLTSLERVQVWERNSLVTTEYCLWKRSSLIMTLCTTRQITVSEELLKNIFNTSFFPFMSTFSILNDWKAIWSIYNKCFTLLCKKAQKIYPIISEKSNTDKANIKTLWHVTKESSNKLSACDLRFILFEQNGFWDERLFKIYKCISME